MGLFSLASTAVWLQHGQVGPGVWCVWRGALPSLHFNVRGREETIGSNQLPISKASAAPAPVHLHDNKGLEKSTQSEFWADKCQANTSFLLLSRWVRRWGASLLCQEPDFVLVIWGSSGYFIRQKSQPIIQRKQRMAFLQGRKDPENPIPLQGGRELEGERNLEISKIPACVFRLPAVFQQRPHSPSRTSNPIPSLPAHRPPYPHPHINGAHLFPFDVQW